MQRHIRFVDPLCLQFIEELARKVQTRGRRGHRARDLRVNRLIGRLVLRVCVALNIRRQRRAAELIKKRQHSIRELELKELALALTHLHRELLTLVVLENHFRPRLRGLARAHHRDRALLSGHALNQSLNCAARGLVTAETSLDHERVVHDEEIARAEELLDVVEKEIFVSALRHYMQQPAVVALFQRKLGNKFFGKIEIKIR